MQGYTIDAFPLTASAVTVDPLPEPAPEALAVSAALVARIGAAIDANAGWLDFASYMQMALYEPGLGYYSAGSAKFGPRGDFTTAPELGDWLAEALAGFIGEALDACGGGELLELGAGSGALAAALLAGLAARGRPDVGYSILETSADLRARQQSRLAALAPGVRWLDTLPAEPIRGIVLANEVVDALPVARFAIAGGAVRPLGVVRDGDGLALAPGPADAELTAAVRRIERDLGRTLPDGYRSEVCLVLKSWLASLCECVTAGGVLLIDYGMTRADYYRPERSDGTLICHYRQRAHNDVLRWPGLQDLTAWVDFSAVAASAEAGGFSLAGYTTQAQFLLAAIAADSRLRTRQPTPAAASALKTLVLPGEMGERFKVIWLTRAAAAPGLPGRDFRNRLGVPVPGAD